MLHKKKDYIYLLRILNSIGKIKLFSREFNNSDDFYYSSNQLQFNACLTLLTQIGESERKISTELKSQNPGIEWKKINDFRNAIIHEYAGVNHEIIFQIIKEKLPILQTDIEAVIRTQIKNKIIDMSVFNLAISNPFYEFVEFKNIL